MVNTVVVMPLGTTVTSVKEVVVITSQIIESAENEIVWIAPSAVLVFTSQYDVHEKAKRFIQNGGRMRGIGSISFPFIELLRRLLDIGEEVRHIDQYQGLFMIVADKRESLSSMNFDAENLAIDNAAVAFWTDDATYAEYLISTFEAAWKQAVPAEKRIEDLLKEGNSSV